MFADIFKMGWRNILRNKRRTFFTLLAIAVGVMSVIFGRSYVAGFIDAISEATIKIQTGHVRIARGEYLRLERIMPKEYMVTGLNRLMPTLAALPGATSVAARIKFNALLSHNEKNEAAVVMGIDPVSADKSMDISKTICAGNYFKNPEQGQQLVIGKKLAEELGVTVNDELLLVTADIDYSTYALPFTVAGIFETGFSMLDKHVLYIPINKAREMLNCGDAAHEILVFLNNPRQAGPAARQIRQELSPFDPRGAIKVIPWQENEIIKDTVPFLETTFGLILGILMFIVGLVILNTMLMAVMERYQETGVIKALGFKNREIFSLILVEAFYIGVIGSAIGGIIGGTLAAIVEKNGIDMTKMMGKGVFEKMDIPIPFFGKVLYTHLTPAILFGSMAFGVVIALLAVIYPAVKSSRMDPVEAFRSQLKI